MQINVDLYHMILVLSSLLGYNFLVEIIVNCMIDYYLSIVFAGK